MVPADHKVVSRKSVTSAYPTQTDAPQGKTLAVLPPPWATLLSAWSNYMRAGGARPGTVEQRTYHVARMARALQLEPAQVTPDDLAEFLARKGWSPNTMRSARAAYRAFWTWATETGRLESSPAHPLPKVRVPRALPRPCPDEVYRWALRFADDRERLAIRLAGQCGLRREEVVQARTDDVERDLAGWSLRVVGKGGHVRVVPLPDDLARIILARHDGWLFPSPRGGHLTPAHLGKVVAARLGEDWTMHNLRHRAGTKSYEATRDLRAVQEFLGHASTDTTMLYTKVVSARVRAAMEGAA